MTLFRTPLRILFGLALLILLVAVASAPAHGQSPVANIPVNADTGGSNQIGTIQITEANGGQIMSAVFGFGPGYAYLEDWYDFRWINIVSEYIVGGTPQPTAPGLGTVPAIDPPPTGQPHDTPFYNNEDAWTGGPGSRQARGPGVYSALVDQPSGHASDTVIVFDTYLVVQDESSGFFPTMFCVLQGFRWTYTQVSAGSPGTVSYVGTLPAASAPINTALGNNSPYPVALTPTLNCPLFLCWNGGWDCPPASQPSDPLPPIRPGAATLTISGGTTCTASAPTVSLAGIPWTGSDTPVTVSGTVSLLYEDTFDPDVIAVEMTSKNLTLSPIGLEGHTIDVVSSTLTSNGVHYHRTESPPNTFGAFEMEFELLVDGAPQTLTHHGWLSAEFDEFTGTWSDLTFGGAFDAQGSGAPVPALQAEGIAVLVTIASVLGIGILRIRRNRIPGTNEGGRPRESTH